MSGAIPQSQVESSIHSMLIADALRTLSGHIETWAQTGPCRLQRGPCRAAMQLARSEPFAFEKVIAASKTCVSQVSPRRGRPRSPTVPHHPWHAAMQINAMPCSHANQCHAMQPCNLLVLTPVPAHPAPGTPTAPQAHTLSTCKKEMSCPSHAPNSLGPALPPAPLSNARTWPAPTAPPCIARASPAPSAIPPLSPPSALHLPAPCWRVRMLAVHANM
jgi:hypothetical protein